MGNPRDQVRLQPVGLLEAAHELAFLLGQASFVLGLRGRRRGQLSLLVGQRLGLGASGVGLDLAPGGPVHRDKRQQQGWDKQ